MTGRTHPFLITKSQYRPPTSFFPRYQQNYTQEVLVYRRAASGQELRLRKSKLEHLALTKFTSPNLG
jgi:hypothetical protein